MTIFDNDLFDVFVNADYSRIDFSRSPVSVTEATVVTFELDDAGNRSEVSRLYGADGALHSVTRTPVLRQPRTPEEEARAQEFQDDFDE